MTSHVERAWDEAAQGYDAYFSPRFAPYLATALGALIGRASDLPSSGCILVPCAGPGRELGPLARAFPARPILASDLSSEMVKLARERNLGFSNVSVARDDATQLQKPASEVAALFSVFGLQLLPKPAETLGSWLTLLQKNGLAVVVYQPNPACINFDPLPFYYLAKLDATYYKDAASCDLCKRGVPVDKVWV